MRHNWAALLTLLILDACTSTSVEPQLPIQRVGIPLPQKAGTWEIYEQYAQCQRTFAITHCSSGALYINHNVLESAYSCMAFGFTTATSVACSQIDVRNRSETGGGIIPRQIKTLSPRSLVGAPSSDISWDYSYWIANGTVPGVAFCYLNSTLEAVCKAASFDNLPD